MRILYLSQYFPPEAGATQTRAFEMARTWVSMGHQVTMICEFPNHPSGVIPSEFRRKLFQRDDLQGIEVIRVWVKTSPEKIFRTRMLFYLSYMFMAVLAGLFLAHGPYDLIYATSPPLFSGGAGLALSFLKRIKIVFEVRDLWPESAVALSELSNPSFIAWAEKLEAACYQHAQVIIAVTQGIAANLVERGLPAGKILFVPNGANLDEFSYQPQARAQWREKLSLGETFIAIYAGIFGLAQGLEIILQAADRLRSRTDIHFIMVGAGPQKTAINNLSGRLALPNVQVLPELPRNDMPGLLSASDIALVPLKDIELFKGALPSKIFDAWACERPVLHTIDGEARQLVEKAQGGVFVPPEDPVALASQLEYLANNRTTCEQMGASGRAYAAKFFNRPVLAGQLMDNLEKVIR